MQPKLRFKGFNDEWESKQLSNLIKLKKSYSITRDNERQYKTQYKYIHYGDIHTKKFTIINNNDELPNIELPSKQYDFLHKNDLVVADASEDYKEIAQPVLLDCEPYNVIAGLHTIAFTPHKNINSKYFYYLLFSNNFKHYVYQVGTGLKVFGITTGNLTKYIAYYPSLPEQQKIGALLAKLDNLINLQVKKLELLKQLKQGLLQKLFPQNNQTTPQLRFKGFNDALKCTELDELTVKIGDGLHGTPQYDENGTLFFINGNNLKNGKIVIFDNTKKVTEQKLNYKLNNNTILMSINGTIGNLAYYNNEFVMLGKSVCYLEINPMHLNKSFLYGLLQTHKIYKEFSLNLTGTTIKNLGLATIKKLKVKYPNLPEQQKIGSLLANLDKLLTKTQEKITLFKQVKKYLLQQMFI